MSAYGPGTDYLRLFESKCRVVSAMRRKALEEATAALDVDTDPPPQYAEGPLATAMARSDPPPERNSPSDSSSASETASKHFPVRTANSRGCVQQRCEDGLAELKLAPVSSPNRRIAGTPGEQQQDRFPSPWRAATFARGISSRAAAAADACISDPIDDVGTGARSSIRSSARQPPSARPPVTVAGHGDVPCRVPSIRTALQDLAEIGDAACHPSPVEQVLARRKRRRRANFGVSSALLLSACTEEVPLPSTPESRPLVTPEDDEHGVTVLGFCDELKSLGLSRISWDSSGSWKSKAASGFPSGSPRTVEGVGRFDEVTDAPQALNADQIPSSKVDNELDSSWNDSRDGFVVSTQARSDHREGTPSGELREVALKQVPVAAASGGGLGCTRTCKRMSRASEKQGKLMSFEACWGDNSDGHGDRCWNQVRQTEGHRKPNTADGMLSFDYDQDAPPSPLPSPPVPLSPTARRGTSTAQRRPPSRVISASGSTLLQQCQDCSRTRDAADSKHNNLCTGEVLTFGRGGNEATSSAARTAKDQAPGEEKMVSQSKGPFSGSCARGSVVDARDDAGIAGMVEQTPQTGGARSPQPRLGDRVGPPETELLQDTEAPATGEVQPKVRLQRAACTSSRVSPSRQQPSSWDECVVSPTSSPSAQKARAARSFGGEEGAQGKALHEMTHDGIDTAVSLSSSADAPCNTSPRVKRNLLNQAYPSKAAAELTVQRWLRRAIQRRKRTSGCEEGAIKRTGELYEPENIEPLQPAKSSTSTARHPRRDVELGDAVHAHAGARPSENHHHPIGKQEAVSPLLAEAATGLVDVVPPYWEDHPVRDRRHELPPDSLAVTSADRDTFGKPRPPSSPAFTRKDDVSHDRPMGKPGSGAEKRAAQRRRSDSRQDDGTVVQPPDLAAQEKEAGVGQAPKRPSSTVLCTAPAPQAASLPLGLSPPVVPPVPGDNLESSEQQPSDRQKRSAHNGNPASGGRDRHSHRGQGRYKLSSSVSNQVLVARDTPCFSVEALGRRFAPADVTCKAGAWYGLTVQEARLRPSNGHGRCGRIPCIFRSPFIGANGRKNCRPDAAASRIAEVPVRAATRHRQQGDKPSMLVARAFARQASTNCDEDAGGNPLLDAWGVGNPLLTRLPSKINGASKGAGAPYG